MSNSADKRSVHTDALAVLGTLIDETVGRDAIHLAVEPIEAGQRLYPGQKVGIVDGKACVHDGIKFVGIVDPFIPHVVPEGARFLLLVFPRTITSLRHVWSHPDFDVEPVKKKVEPTNEPVKYDHPTSAEPIRYVEPNQYDVSRSWIEDYASQYSIDYEEIMATAWSQVNAERQRKDGSNWAYGEYITGGAEMEGERVSDEFWQHFQIVTGETLSDDEQQNFSPVLADGEKLMVNYGLYNILCRPVRQGQGGSQHRNFGC